MSTIAAGLARSASFANRMLVLSNGSPDGVALYRVGKG
jgi:hypothetical protein